ncbi:MAG: hypothetical protein V1659_05770 [Candidatus Woesearchaeota archaeon]
MVDNIITTGVDELIEILKSRDKMPISDAARLLKTPLSVVQSWVDFLVEEKILGVEYKFTKPYIYLNRPDEEKTKETGEKNREKQKSQNIQSFKDNFKEKAREKNIPESKVHYLWQNHIMREVELKKQFFFIEAKKRDFFDAEELWTRYKQHLLEL